MSKIQFRTPYDPTPRDSDLRCEDPSLAQQAFKDEVDINVILEKYKITGVMPASVRLPEYGDFSHVQDYRSALEAINRARDDFMTLPPGIRSRFENDPQKFLEFCSNPQNATELASLGLAKQKGPEAKPQGEDGSSAAA